MVDENPRPSLIAVSPLLAALTILSTAITRHNDECPSLRAVLNAPLIPHFHEKISKEAFVLEIGHYFDRMEWNPSALRCCRSIPCNEPEDNEIKQTACNTVELQPIYMSG